MARRIYSEEHDIFRQSFKKFLEKEVMPFLEEWEAQGEVPRSAWKKMGEQGYLCPWLKEKYGGSEAGFEYSIIITEEMSRVRANGFSASLHSDIVAPYIHHYGTEAQKEKWLPGCASGDIVLAVAMTEPGAGSDLQAIRTRAVREGDHYVLNGQKTFITNGYSCDLVIVAVKTDPEARPAHKGISLIAVEAGTPGFVKGRRLSKMGLHFQDTAELFFEDCRVPHANLIGQEGRGFGYLMDQLQQERLVVVCRSQVAAEEMLRITIAYAKQREAFGQPIGRFQHNAFKIAEMATEVELGRTFFDDLVADHLEGRDIVTKVSMAKWWIAEMANRVAYHCVQLHGGYGFMDEYPISKWYRDIRAATLYAGTTEIMKYVIARRLGF
jgi:alkylation response protein AidB-like acyl-CoA dehydrogenase